MQKGEKNEPRVTVRELARRAGLTHEEARRFVDAIGDELVLGREVRLTGVGILRVVETRARKLVTPMFEAGSVKIPRSRSVRFRQSKVIKMRLNRRRRKGGSDVRDGTE